MEPIKIKIKTLTPIWTGGANGTCDRIHETGILGSLRWWYEAIVRGLGGYACDPAAETRCNYDPQKGEKSICAACHLFGCTGWARLFRFQWEHESDQRHPLHFYSALNPNIEWLTSIFDPRHGGDTKTSTITGLYVHFGEFPIRLVFRGVSVHGAKSQLGLLLRFIENHTGIGAKLQHGFGIVFFDDLSGFPADGLTQLQNDINGKRFKTGNVDPQLPDLRRFLCKTFSKNFGGIFGQDKCVGTEPTRSIQYIPCAFDIRYKGSGKFGFGFRRFLEQEKGWRNQLNRLNRLMGASKKGDGTMSDVERSGCMLNFGMPYRAAQNNTHTLRIYGVIPPTEAVNEIGDLIDEYMKAIQAGSLQTTHGIDALKGARNV